VAHSQRRFQTWGTLARCTAVHQQAEAVPRVVAAVRADQTARGKAGVSARVNHPGVPPEAVGPMVRAPHPSISIHRNR
jgi:hypothetical protein